MNKIIIVLLIQLISLSTFAEIESVSQGDAIYASKLNEIITELNAVKANKQGALALGTIQQSILTLIQFQSVQGTCWRLMDGSSLVGTDLNTLTGIMMLPNAMADGTFIRQAKTGRILGSFEAQEIQAHAHKLASSGSSSISDNLSGTNYIIKNPNGNTNYFSYALTGTNTAPTFGLSSSVGGSENRPNNIAVNYFIKVNNFCN